MRWCAVYHPDLAASAVIAESALPIHKGKGWYRTSEWGDDPVAMREALDRDARQGVPQATTPKDEPEPAPVPSGPPVDLDATPETTPASPAPTAEPEE